MTRLSLATVVMILTVPMPSLADPPGCPSMKIDWFTIDGGGTMNAESISYKLGGTIGQPDATAHQVLNSSSYRLTGGFWAGADISPMCVGIADANHDCAVNIIDLMMVIDGWGVCPQPCECVADVNHDAAVNVPDLLIVINHWG